MAMVMACERCNQPVETTTHEYRKHQYIMGNYVCAQCYDAQERDFNQKLPVKVRVVWEVWEV